MKVELSDENVTLVTADFEGGKVFVFGSQNRRKKLLRSKGFSSKLWHLPLMRDVATTDRYGTDEGNNTAVQKDAGYRKGSEKSVG